MILLDTNAIVFDALQPARLSRKARRLIEQAHGRNELACCDISLWEIAMLVSKGRLDPGVSTLEFIKLVLTARSIQVLAINPEIAGMSVTLGDAIGLDPADRLVAATAIHHRATLITTDNSLKHAGLPITIHK
jgi:PIN domain nuclease of toxin-antitoxin system